MGLSAALLVASVPGIARADVVKLDNGDVLHGQVIGGDDKTVKFKHATGGDLTIEYAKITSIETDAPVEVKLADGSRLKGKLAPGAGAGAFSVATESAGSIPVEAARIAAVNEPPESVVWTGRIAVGATIVDGNSQSKNAFMSGDVERLSRYDRIEAHAYYAYAQSKDQVTRVTDESTKKGFARVQYSYYVLRPLYLYVGGAFEYDHFAGLQLRSRGGGGLGLALVEEKNLLARVEAGVEYVNEDYRRSTPDKDFTSIRGAGQFEWQATSFLRLGESFEIFPNTERFRDFFLRSTSSANFSLFKGFGVAFVIIWEHDQIPATPDRNRNDTQYLVTLTYVF